MLAVRSVSHSCADPPIVTASHYTYSNQTLTTTMNVSLVDCTAEHFKKSPYIYENFNILTQRNWKCLPLNTSY